MTPRRWQLTLITLLAGLLAACSAPQGPSLSATETAAAIQELWQNGSSVGSSAAWNQLPTDAIAAVSTAALPAGTPPGSLPRGVYTYDQLGDAWVKTGDSDDLELNWLHEAVAYRVSVDWDASGPTTMVEDVTGVLAEVPTGAAAALLEGGVEVGSLALGSSWTGNLCGYDEPTGASLSGYLGHAGARLTLDELGFSVADTAGSDTVSVEARATATVDGDSLSGYLELTGHGQLARDADCNLVGFTPNSGSLAAGASGSVGGEQRSLDFQTSFSGPDYDGSTLVGIDLDGSLRLDGVSAVSFVGALNDANANGVPGDQLVLTFADEQTMSLEEFLIDQVGWGPLAALRLLTR